MSKSKPKTFFERELENPEFRKAYEASKDAFNLEIQILMALEEKHWNYADLAKALGTHKKNVWRDFRVRLKTIKLSRLNRIADALGMKLVTMLVPKDKK